MKRAKLKESTIKRKTKVIWTNLIIFVILFVTSLVLYSASGYETYKDLFFILTLIFGVVSLALLISLLVYKFAKYFKK